MFEVFSFFFPVFGFAYQPATLLALASEHIIFYEEKEYISLTRFSMCTAFTIIIKKQMNHLSNQLNFFHLSSEILSSLPGSSLFERVKMCCMQYTTQAIKNPCRFKIYNFKKAFLQDGKLGSNLEPGDSENQSCHSSYSVGCR